MTSHLMNKCAFYLIFSALTTVMVTGCVTAGSLQSQLYSQTQQNRSLLRIEQQRSRDLIANRASLQRQMDKKSQQRDRLQIQDNPTPETREEIQKLNSEIAKLKKSILEST